MGIYEPAEDSYLVQQHINEYAEGRVLDMGAGSGILALAAVNNPKVKEVVAVDINPDAVRILQEKINSQKLRKLKVFQSDLFEKVSGEFNLIIFNPPYLPQDKGIEDAALYGGKKGWEISARFLAEVSSHLHSEGIILFLFSSLTNKRKIEELIDHRLFQFSLIDAQKLAFEELYLYAITKTKLLRQLEGRLIENISYFSRGQRGVIYTGYMDRSKLVKTHLPGRKNIVQVTIKVKRKDSLAEGRIGNEVEWLTKLNPEGIGPKLVTIDWDYKDYNYKKSDYLVYEFVEGEYILDWIKKNSKEEIKTLINSLLDQCFKLDKLKVNKEELHRPYKHILITAKNKPVMIDFERCSESPKVKNITQFTEFICRLKPELAQKEFNFKLEDLRQLAREYKTTRSFELLQKIKDAIK